MCAVQGESVQIRCHPEPTPMTFSGMTCSGVPTGVTLSTPSCPTTMCTATGAVSSNIDTKFREVHELSQQIEELREQLLDVKRSASFSRSKRSCSYSSTRTASEVERSRAKSYSSRRSTSAPAQSAFTTAIDQLIEECPEEEMENYQDLETVDTDKSTPPFRGTITWDDTVESARGKKRGHKSGRKKKGPCNGLWRLFGGICG